MHFRKGGNQMKLLAKLLGVLMVLSVLSWGLPHSAFASRNGTGQANDGTGDSHSSDHTGNFDRGAGGNDTH